MGSRKVKTETSLGVFLHTCRTLSYSWKHAIGEMVDNAVDSYLEHKDQLPNGIDIRINYDGPGKKLTIIDNAFGMDQESIEAAVQITRRHPTKDYYEGGIGRYGLGLKKSATCLGDKWKVITKGKDTDKKFSVNVDVMKLYENNASEVIITDSISKGKHGTRIEIDLRRSMKGKAAKSVKSSLAEMYRYYIEEGEIRIWWNEEEVEYSQPSVRKTETETKDGVEKQIWWSTIDLPVKKGTKKVATVPGEVYILETMSNTTSGIQLFHSNRLVVGGSGSPNNNWRPAELVGGAENYRARRFCAVLHLDMLQVNHQKDGFAWDIFDDDDLLKALKESKLVGSYLSESRKSVGKKPGPSTSQVAKNILKRLDSKSVQNTVNEEIATKEQSPRKLSKEVIEAMVRDSGIILETGKEPKVTVSFVDQPYGPIVTSMVTGQEKGRDLLRILINERHEYFEVAIGSEEEKELWIEFLHGMALTEHALAGVDKLDFPKIVDTLGKFLVSFRASDE